ncbi:MAG TPA: T9SS type A sorting domain-containing protein [candidate division Zixibacteria bacterium]
MRFRIITLIIISLVCLIFPSLAFSQEDPDKKEIIITVSFAFNFIDSIPPYLDSVAPPRNAKRVPPDTNIVFHVKDSGYGVDLSSIRLWIGGQEIIGFSSSIEGSPSDYKVTYFPPTQFPWGGEILVRVSAHDIASPPNQLDTSYSFKIEPGPALTLANASIFPNPFKPYQGHTFVTFDGLTTQAKIEVFTIVGERVYTVDETDGDGKVVWNVVNSDGKKLASGVYICRITNDKGEEKFFKLAVIR